MANILGTITDSVGNTLDGTLTFELLTHYVDDTTNPDTLRTPFVSSFDIVDGNVNINVPESQTLGVPYRITFTESTTDEPYFATVAVVPNVGTVQFASLAPTGITQSTLDTSAVRVARLLTKDDDLAPIIRRPIVQSFNFSGIDDVTRFYMVKSHTGGTHIYSVEALFITGRAGWSVDFGRVAGATLLDELITPTSVNEFSANGRTRVTRLYNVDTLPTVAAHFIELAPDMNSVPAFGCVTVRMVENA
jgi:hypothetical protein